MWFAGYFAFQVSLVLLCHIGCILFLRETEAGFYRVGMGDVWGSSKSRLSLISSKEISFRKLTVVYGMREFVGISFFSRDFRHMKLILK